MIEVSKDTSVTAALPLLDKDKLLKSIFKISAFLTALAPHRSNNRLYHEITACKAKPEGGFYIPVFINMS